MHHRVPLLTMPAALLRARRYLKLSARVLVKGVGRKDVSVTRDKLGKPKALLSGRALEIAQELGVVEVALSITLTGDLAVANAIAITEDARPKPKEEKVSTKKRVAQTFKEARSVLDELEQLQNSALTEHLGDASQDTLGA